MMQQLKRWFLRLLSRIFSDAWANWLARLISRRAVERIRSKATDDLLETLLWAMDICFCLDAAYREAHLAAFSANYVFTTAEGDVSATAQFRNGRMHVSTEAEPDYSVRIRFKDAAALRRFLFADSPDVLEALLANEVELDGNLNYVYKFGFMVKDLEHRLGLLT